MSVRPTANRPRGRGRRRTVFVAATALVLLAGAGVAVGIPNRAERAEALAPPTSITLPPPTTSPTPLTWDATSMILRDDGVTIGAPTADRYFTQPLILTQSTTAARLTAGASVITVPLPVTTQPAGSSALIGGEMGGRFSFPPTPLPDGATLSIKVREAGQPGLLCRTREVSPLPASGVPLRILVPKAISESPAALQAMVANFKGPISGTPAGTSAGIIAAGLTPQNDGLSLGLLGLLRVGTYNFIFGYKVTLTLTPSTSSNLGSYLTVQTPNPGTLTLAWFGPAPANGDLIRAFVAAAAEPQLRAAIPPQATPIVNNAISTMHDVQWWTEQGFTLSVRNVAYSTSGLSVAAAVCRMG